MLGHDFTDLMVTLIAFPLAVRYVQQLLRSVTFQKLCFLCFAWHPRHMLVHVYSVLDLGNMFLFFCVFVLQIYVTFLVTGFCDTGPYIYPPPSPSSPPLYLFLLQRPCLPQAMLAHCMWPTSAGSLEKEKGHWQ